MLWDVSRLNVELFQPRNPPVVLVGGRSGFESETVFAYERGYRSALTQWIALSVSTFFSTTMAIFEVSKSARRKEMARNVYGKITWKFWMGVDGPEIQ